jgi:hypothetical protein
MKVNIKTIKKMPTFAHKVIYRQIFPTHPDCLLWKLSFKQL